MDKDYLFREILNTIRGLDCYLDHHQFYEFFMNDKQREFRLGGKFGFGFKLYKNYNNYRFGQYIEDETKESIEWITNTNEKLINLISFLKEEHLK